MSRDLAARPARGPHADLVRAIEAIARETNAAFEALARRRYDAPWQRIPAPRPDGCRTTAR